MPTISVEKTYLWKQLEKDTKYSIEDFEALCFDFGIELDEVVVEDGKDILKIEVGANRYDLVCPQGIALALRVFMGIQEFPKFKIKPIPESKMLVMNVHESTAAVRPLIACAVLRNITFTKETYDDFIALQDRLHANVARQRTLVSIGTHDLDTIKGPFEYTADLPSKVEFIPLNQTKSIKGTEFMEFYEKDRHLGKYLHIIRDKPSPENPLLPIIRDSSKEKWVLSLPPIINSEHSKITVNTKNILIEITATDETKVAIVNNIITSMFSLYTDPKFEVEPVKIVSPHNGQSRITPDFTPTLFNASVSYLNSCTGLDYTPEQQCELLKRMCLEASPSPKSPDQLVVKCPPTRADVLHEADIMEDFAVAYGFNNLPRYYPNKSAFVAAPLPINKLADIVRLESAMAGWTEALPLILCSHDENFAFLNRKDDGQTAIVLANPKSAEYQVVRTSLLPGLLKTIRENKHRAVPLRVFEVADVGLKDEERERKTRNERRFGAVYYGKSSGFEVVQGLMDRVMAMLDYKFRSAAQDHKQTYWIEQLEDPTYFHGHAASVHIQQADGTQHVVGQLGIIHPTVNKAFELPFVASAMEINLEIFL